MQFSPVVSFVGSFCREKKREEDDLPRSFLVGRAGNRNILNFLHERAGEEARSVGLLAGMTLGSPRTGVHLAINLIGGPHFGSVLYGVG